MMKNKVLILGSLFTMISLTSFLLLKNKPEVIEVKESEINTSRENMRKSYVDYFVWLESSKDLKQLKEADQRFYNLLNSLKYIKLDSQKDFEIFDFYLNQIQNKLANLILNPKVSKNFISKLTDQERVLLKARKEYTSLAKGHDNPGNKEKKALFLAETFQR